MVYPDKSYRNKDYKKKLRRRHFLFRSSGFQPRVSFISEIADIIVIGNISRGLVFILGGFDLCSSAYEGFHTKTRVI